MNVATVLPRPRVLVAAVRAFLLLVVAVVCGACPVGDPVTMSVIENDTAATVEVELTLDMEHWDRGFTPEEFQAWLDELTDEWVEGELRQFMEGTQGASLVSMDRARFAGTFRLEPAATLTVSHVMGTGPYHYLSSLVVTRGDAVETFTGKDGIGDLFQPVEGHVWAFRITDGP